MNIYLKRKLMSAAIALALAIAVGVGIVVYLDYKADQAEDARFHPGLHEARAGDTWGGDFVNVGQGDAEILFVVFFDTDCPYCHAYAEELQDALEMINSGAPTQRALEKLKELEEIDPAELETEEDAETLAALIEAAYEVQDILASGELTGKVAITMVNAVEDGDRAVRDFANEHNLTFPVLAGMFGTDAKMWLGDPPKYPSTVIFWKNWEGQWVPIDAHEGMLPSIAIPEMAHYWLNYDWFKPGLHEVRSGETGETVLDFLHEQVQIVFVIYTSTQSGLGNSYVDVMVTWWTSWLTTEYSWRIGMAVVNTGYEGDQALRDFAELHRLRECSDDCDKEIYVPVIGGATEDNTGVPEGLIPWSSKVQLEPGPTPALFILWEDVDGWHTLGFLNPVDPYYLEGLVYSYFMDRDARGF